MYIKRPEANIDCSIIYPRFVVRQDLLWSMELTDLISLAIELLQSSYLLPSYWGYRNIPLSLALYAGSGNRTQFFIITCIAIPCFYTLIFSISTERPLKQACFPSDNNFLVCHHDYLTPVFSFKEWEQ